MATPKLASLKLALRIGYLCELWVPKDPEDLKVHRFIIVFHFLHY
jgi:hypothetical protein